MSMWLLPDECVHRLHRQAKPAWVQLQAGKRFDALVRRGTSLVLQFAIRFVRSSAVSFTRLDSRDQLLPPVR